MHEVNEKFVLISKLVTDWGGFEKFVEEMHKTSDVQVQRNIKLHGKSGVPRQIDVLVKHTKGLYTYQTVIECKYWKKKVERMHIDALASTLDDLEVEKGAFFTTKGYQSGAKNYAKSKNIDIFKVKDLTDEDWGLTGRFFQMYLQLFTKTVYNVFLERGLLISKKPKRSSDTLELNLRFGDDQTITETFDKNGNALGSLEDLIDDHSQRILHQFHTGFNGLINGGINCTHYVSVNVRLVFEKPRFIRKGRFLLNILEIRFDVGIRISQSYIEIDRAKHYDFAIAVENCITEKQSIIYRKTDNKEVVISKFRTKKGFTVSENIPNKDEYKNGSIYKVALKSWFDPKELGVLKPVASPKWLTDIMNAGKYKLDR